MRKIFALAALVLGVVSCQTEPEGFDATVGGEQDVNITVSLPEATRSNSAVGAFGNVDFDDYDIRYIFQVFNADGTAYKAKQVEYSDATTVSFPVRLIPNRTYNFVVWADLVKNGEKENAHYTIGKSLENITLNTWAPMDETRDAYTGKTSEEFNGNPIEVTLTRPFAKLRVKTTDMAELLGVVPAKAKVTYHSDHYTSFNALNQTPGTKANDGDHDTFTIVEYENEGENKKTLFTDYFFATESQEAVNFTLEVLENDGTTRIIERTFNTDIPVKRNNLTTIEGNILTMGDNITVKINPEFGGETQWPDANNKAEQLAYAAMFGGEVTLTEDVTLDQPLEIVKGANVVIDLGGKTLTGAIDLAEGAELTVNNGVINNTDKTVSGITTNGNLTLNNVTIESARHGVRVESGKVVINGGEYKVVPISTSTLHALNVGDDGTTAEVVIKGGTFIGPKGTMADSGSAVNVRNGSSVVIEGGNFSGGKTKTLSGNITVKGGTFDQNPSAFVVAGYKAIAADGLYYVLPETIANAAEAEGVTSVTESTADVATALATNNGEATLFMWNDVAYIAKYGEVVITSIADEATTVRGVVEYSAGLTSATVAEGIEVVGNRTFRKCANLETVALPNTLTEIGPAVFQSCSKLANITIPESVTTIGEGAFAECTALTSINIPAGITRLEKDVLRNTGLVSVEIPASVNYIGTYAFRDCESLTEIKILSPEFTIENNTFTNMAAPVPTMTIHVVNAEMEAYLNSTLTNYDKTYITVVGPKDVSDSNALKDEVNKKNATVNVAAGEYTFPASVAAGVTIICEEGTVFTGTSGLNINGATVIGAEFENTGNAVSGTVNGTFKDCTFTGSNALRSCYAGETVIFENCVFDGDVYGVHFDGGENDAIFRNCVFSGFNAFGAALTKLTLEGCTFVGNGKSGYNGANLWGSTTLKNCEFTFNGTTANEWIDCIKADGTYSFENCTINGVAYTSDNYTSYGDIFSRNDTTVKINGVDCAL